MCEQNLKEHGEIWRNLYKITRSFVGWCRIFNRVSASTQLRYTWQSTDLLNITYSLQRTTNLHYWIFFFYADFSCIWRIYSTIHVSETGTLQSNLNILVFMYNLQLWDTAPVREAQSTRNKEACSARCEASTMRCWRLWRWVDGFLNTRRFERTCRLHLQWSRRRRPVHLKTSVINNPTPHRNKAENLNPVARDHLQINTIPLSIRGGGGVPEA